jgi:D-tyrosyl-tRNA(Tyr) deacylase
VRAVVQRTKCSKVVVDHKTCGEIGAGLMVLLGIKKGDTEKEAQYMMDKIINLRIFPDEEGKMNRSLLDMGGELLLVSQFTLYGDARKGRRPGFSEAALPKEAMALYKYSICAWINKLELSIFLQSENTLNFNTEDLQAYF